MGGGGGGEGREPKQKPTQATNIVYPLYWHWHKVLFSPQNQPARSLILFETGAAIHAELTVKCHSVYVHILIQVSRSKDYFIMNWCNGSAFE